MEIMSSLRWCWSDPRQARGLRNGSSHVVLCSPLIETEKTVMMTLLSYLKSKSSEASGHSQVSWERKISQRQSLIPIVSWRSCCSSCGKSYLGLVLPRCQRVAYLLPATIMFRYNGETPPDPAYPVLSRVHPYPSLLIYR